MVAQINFTEGNVRSVFPYVYVIARQYSSAGHRIHQGDEKVAYLIGGSHRPRFQY